MSSVNVSRDGFCPSHRDNSDFASQAKVSSLTTHLEGLIDSLESRKSEKGGTVLGIHVDEDHEEDEGDGFLEDPVSVKTKTELGAAEESDDEVEGSRSSTLRASFLTPSELSKLQREVSSRDAAVLSQIPLPLLKGILSFLDTHINTGLQAQFTKQGLQALQSGVDLGHWIQLGEGKQLAQQLKGALQAAEIMLSFLTAEGVDRTALSEERIEKGCGLLKHLVLGLLVPAHAFAQGDDELKTSSSTARSKKTTSARTPATSSAGELNDEGRNDGGVARGDAKPLARAVHRIFDSGGGLALMERLEMLVGAVRVDDQHLFTLSASAFGCLPIKCDIAELPRLRTLQQHALGLLKNLFSKYEHHRKALIDDLFGVMLRLPSGKKFNRTFKLHKMAKGLLLGGGGLGEAGTEDFASEASDNIQVMTALIMLLVQSCVVDRPRVLRGPPSNSSYSTNTGIDVEYLSKAVKVSHYLMQQLLARCQKKEEGSEFRPILSSLVDDLLAACVLPDWPGAETLLSCLSMQLTNDLKTHTGGAKGEEDGKGDGGHESSVGAGGNQYLALALELLGRVATRLRIVVRVDRECPLVLPEAVDLVNDAAGPLDSHETVGCPCGFEVNYGGLMLDCDRCHRWFHGVCVGVSEEEELPNEWNCEDCKITQLVARQRDIVAKKRQIRARVAGKELFGGGVSGALDTKTGAVTLAKHEESEEHGSPKRKSKRAVRRGASATPPSDQTEDLGLMVDDGLKTVSIKDEPEVGDDVIEDKDVFRQLLLNYLTERAQTEPWMRQARHYHLAHWLQDYEQESQAGWVAHFCDQWDLPSHLDHAGGFHQRTEEAWLDSSSNGARLDDHGTARVVRSLIVKGAFVGRFDKLLVRLFHLLGDNTPTLRSKVMKAVSAIVEVDPVLMANENIHTAIIQRFYDSSISVRQAAVDLVGRFALLTPQLLDQYYDALADRLLDTGVSVRKSVVKILRDALLKHPNFSRRSHVCHLLVQRASYPKEEDSIKDLVRRTFEQFWFDDRHADEVFAASAAFAASASSVSSAAAVSPRNADLSPHTPKGLTLGQNEDALSLHDGSGDGNENPGAHVLLLQDNPKTPGTKSWERYEKYKSATTMTELVELGATLADVRHDKRKGFLIVSGNSAMRGRGLGNDFGEEGANTGGRMLDDSEDLLPGWGIESTATGTTFISPTGQRCFSKQEALEVARRERKSLAPSRPCPSATLSTSSGVCGGGGGRGGGRGGGGRSGGGGHGLKQTFENDRIVASAAQMIEVVHGIASSGRVDWFVELLKGMLAGLGGGEGTKAKQEEKNRRAAVADRCLALVNCFIEFLLTLEEKGEGELPFSLSTTTNTLNPSPETPASNAASRSIANTQVNGSEEGRSAVLRGILSTMHAFCKASPSLISYEHMVTLLPYLTADNHVGTGEAEVCRLVANIVTWALPHTDEQKRDPMTLKRSVEHLKRLTFKFGTEVVHAAVECLEVITSETPVSTGDLTAMKKTGECTQDFEEEPLMSLAQQFYKALRQRVDLNTFQKGDLSYVQRGLVVLGSVCRFRHESVRYDDDLDGNDESDDEELGAAEADAEGRTVRAQKQARSGGPARHADSAASMPDFLDPGNFRSACYRIFLAFLRKESPVVAQNALRGLSSQLIGCPRLMIQADRDGIVASVLTHHSPIVKLEALLQWRAILEAEEHRVESGLARRQMQSRMLLTTHGSTKKGKGTASARDGKKGGVRFGGDDGDPEECDEEDEECFEEEFAREELEAETMTAATRRQVQGDQDADSSVVGGVLQAHIVSIQNLLFEGDHSSAAAAKASPKIRNAAASLLAVMLRQGLVNPLQVLPSVVALLGDSSEKLRAEAGRLLLVEDEKQPDFLRQRFVEGVCHAYILQTRISGVAMPLVLPESNSSVSKQQQSIFAGVYSQCIRQNRVKRQTVLKSLLGLFGQKRAGDVSKWKHDSQGIGGSSNDKFGSPPSSSSSSSTSSFASNSNGILLDLGFLAFLAQTLCFLPYDVQEEALFIVNHVSRFVSYEGSALLKRFQTELVAAGVNVAEDSDDDDADTSSHKKLKGDFPERQDTASAASGELNRTNGTRAAATTSSLVMRRLCCEAVAVCMLLRVKHYLKDVYRLSNAKCSEYAPAESTKASEKPIFRPDDMPALQLPSSALIDALASGQVLTVGDAADLLVEFKRLLREDPADYRLHVTVKKGSGGRKRQGKAFMSDDPSTADEALMPAVMRQAAEKTKAAIKKSKTKKKASKAKKRGANADNSGSDDFGSGEDSDFGG